ncbi:MAG: glycosyltransferase family 4 protein [Planctomycetota bacterium]
MIFASAFYPSIGGIEEVVRQVSIQNKTMGRETAVFTNRWPRSLPERETYEGIDLHRYAFRVPDVNFKSRVTYRLTHNRVLSDVIDALSEHRCDVIHVHGVSSNAKYALEAHRQLGTKLVVSTHGEVSIDATGLYQRSERAVRLMHELLQVADLVTAPSAYTLGELADQFKSSINCPQQVISNGIDLREFAETHPYQYGSPYILAIGRLTRQKGFDVLIEAVAQADLNGHEVLIAGEGYEAAMLQRQINDLKLNDRVRLIGPVNREKAVSLFYGATCVAVPSRDEPLGIVNLEAMAASKAVIASRVGGIPEIVKDQERGMLVPACDVQALAVGLEQLVHDPELAQRLGERGQQYVRQNHNWNDLAKQYLRGYAQIGVG